MPDDVHDISAAPDTLTVQVGKDVCPSPHSWKNKAGRVLWGLVWCLLFRTSPRICFGWRSLLLRLFGAKLGINSRISPTVKIWAPWNLTLGDEVAIAHDADIYCVAPISIGNHATISQYAYLCAATHDIADPHMRLVMKAIVIEDQAWICAKAFVGPGVTVHQGAVLGACAVTVKDLPAWSVAIGNPARIIKTRRLVSSKTGPVDSQ